MKKILISVLFTFSAFCFAETFSTESNLYGTDSSALVSALSAEQEAAILQPNSAAESKTEGQAKEQEVSRAQSPSPAAENSADETKAAKTAQDSKEVSSPAKESGEPAQAAVAKETKETKDSAPVQVAKQEAPAPRHNESTARTFAAEDSRDALLADYPDTESSSESSVKTQSKDEANKSYTFSSGRRGRNALIFSMTDFHPVPLLDNFASSLSIDNLDVTLTLALGKYFYTGTGFGVNLSKIPEDFSLTLTNSLGVCFELGQNVRPYFQVNTQFTSDFQMGAAVGGGLDIILGKVLVLNLGYSYGAYYDMNPLLKVTANTEGSSAYSVSFDKTADFAKFFSHPELQHSISIGIGITW